MNKLLKLFVMPLIFLLSVFNLFWAVVGAILFRVFSMFVGLSAICTIWAWVIGDKMAPLFAGITAGTCALLLAGTLLSQKSEAILTHLVSQSK